MAVDGRGCLLACFEAQRINADRRADLHVCHEPAHRVSKEHMRARARSAPLSLSGRITRWQAYMNRLMNTHPAAIEFGLNRDPARWGKFMLITRVHTCTCSLRR